MRAEQVSHMADQLMTAVAAGILFRAGDQVLLLKRGPGGDNPGTWGFPAGHIEEGETPLQGALREVEEETSYRVHGEPEEVSQDGGFVLFRHDCERFDVLLCDESDGFVWTTREDLPQPLHPGVAEAIEAEFSRQETADAMDWAEMVAIGDAWALDKAESARSIDVNGWFEVKGNPLSKVGIFEYRGAQIPGAPDPTKMYRVYRPAEELGAPECVESFRLIPWIDNHVMLGDEDMGLTPAERKGVQGVVGEDTYFDPDAFEGGGLFGNIKVFSQSLATLIEAGKRELSAGYRCRYEWEAGTWNGQAYDCVQRQIRGNHLASVHSGRMGPEVAVLDSHALDQSTDQGEPQMAEEKDGQGGSGGMTLEQALEAFASLMPVFEALKAKQADVTGGVDTDTNPPGDNPNADKDDKATDAEDPKTGDDGEKKFEDKQDKGEGMDAAEVQKVAQGAVKEALAMVGRRDELAARLSVHVGTFDHKDMTEAEVAKYGVQKLGLSVSAGEELPALKGFLAAAKDPRKEAVAHGMDAKADNFVTRHLKKGA